MFRNAHRFAAQTLRFAILGTLVMTLAACNSRANPMNWFGRNDPVIVRAEDPGPEPEVNPLIPTSRASIFRDDDAEIYGGTLVAQVSDISIERAPGMAVLRVSGVAESLGAFDVRLVPVIPAPDDSTLRFELRALQPPDTRGQGTDAARTVNVAVSLTDQTLSFVRDIEVVAAQNTRTVRP